MLHVLTYNIHKAIGNDRRYRPDRILEILRASKADILCLQEVDYRVPRSRNDDLAHLLANGLGFHCALGLNVFLKHGAYGNAILSRYPIVHTENLNITWGIKKARGCLMSRIQAPGGEVAVMNMHLGLAGFERSWQVRKILRSAFFERVRTLPTVVLGDTNDRAEKVDRLFALVEYVDSSSPNGRLQGGELHSARNWRRLKELKNVKEIRRLKFPVELQTFPSYAPFPLIRIDKVFVNDRFRVKSHEVLRNRATKVASDHLPVVVGLEVGAPISSY